jgi:hypothetical protein
MVRFVKDMSRDQQRAAFWKMQQSKSSEAPSNDTGTPKQYSAPKRHHLERPSHGSQSFVHRDVKRMMEKDDAVEEGESDYKAYRKRLTHQADSDFLKEYKHAEHIREKEIKREIKQHQKEEDQQQEPSEQKENIV